LQGFCFFAERKGASLYLFFPLTFTVAGGGCGVICQSFGLQNFYIFLLYEYNKSIYKKSAVKKAAVKKAVSQKVPPKPGTLEAIHKAMAYGKKHPIKFTW
jgi:hypothetical protein